MNTTGVLSSRWRKLLFHEHIYIHLVVRRVLSRREKELDI